MKWRLVGYLPGVARIESMEHDRSTKAAILRCVDQVHSQIASWCWPDIQWTVEWDRNMTGIPDLADWVAAETFDFGPRGWVSA